MLVEYKIKNKISKDIAGNETSRLGIKKDININKDCIILQLVSLTFLTHSSTSVPHWWPYLYLSQKASSKAIQKHFSLQCIKLSSCWIQSWCKSICVLRAFEGFLKNKSSTRGFYVETKLNKVKILYFEK